MTTPAQPPSSQLMVYPDSVSIAQYMADKPVGTLVTYREISALIKKDCLANRAPVQSALRKLRRIGIVYGNVSKEGYKRLDNLETAGAANSYLSQGRKRLKTAVLISGAVKFEELPPAMARQLTTDIGSAGLFITHTSVSKRLAASADEQLKAKLMDAPK